MNEELKQLSALTSLNHMMRGGHFSICAVDAVGELLGIDPRGSDAAASRIRAGWDALAAVTTPVRPKAAAF